MRRDIERLHDILNAIQRIEKYSQKGKEEFLQDELIQNWIQHHLQIIGEACNRLSDSFYLSHPEIPWKSIIGLRHILVHHYFEIDYDLIWNVVENDLPEFKSQIETIINQNQ